MTTHEIREALAQKNNCASCDVRCSKCNHWAYNHGGVITSVGSSRCKVHRHKTDCYQFCRGFTPVEKK